MARKDIYQQTVTMGFRGAVDTSDDVQSIFLNSGPMSFACVFSIGSILYRIQRHASLQDTRFEKEDIEVEGFASITSDSYQDMMQNIMIYEKAWFVPLFKILLCIVCMITRVVVVIVTVVVTVLFLYVRMWWCLFVFC